MRYFYVEPVKGDIPDRKNIKGAVIWEDSDFPKKELLSHPVPEGYIGTGTSPYLIELFENAWSDGEYLPEGYIPILMRSPLTAQSITTPVLKEASALMDENKLFSPLRLILKATFDRFGIKYHELAKQTDILDAMETLSIPFFMKKKVLPQNVDAIYYLALAFQKELLQSVNLGGLKEIWNKSQTHEYPKDSSGYVDLAVLNNMVNIFRDSDWFIKNEFLSPVKWVEFFDLFTSYGSEAFMYASKNIESSQIVRLLEIGGFFRDEPFEELINLTKHMPDEWFKSLQETVKHSYF